MFPGSRSHRPLLLEGLLPTLDRRQADVHKLGDFREGDLLSKKTRSDATADLQLRRCAFGSHSHFYGDST